MGLKRLLLGRPLASEEAGHQLLPILLALPVFASDALSSNAYATEEILHHLEEAGEAGLTKAIPIAIAVAALMLIVVASYRQTVRAYPRGGGSYIVTKENLGIIPGLVAAGALLIDYILTVSVSIAAGAFAITSLLPELSDHRVALALSFLVLVTLLNLRGAKESGVIFAVPTYGFVLSILIMLGTGLVRCAAGSCPTADAAHAIETTRDASLFLILLAFSSGSTALTGVEAIADGVGAFRGRRPQDQARNAATTLAMLAGISITMFIGITILANKMEVLPSDERSVVAQVAHATFGGGIGFGIVQVMTALILVLAANTAYQDFPRLSSILAKDRFMPRQFINRGDRLVFSNGILVLAGLAALLIWLFDAEVSRLIQLYVVGVFTSFTLSQTGMVLRWKRLRAPQGWQRRAVVNTIGAVTTGVVLLVVAITKFNFPHAGAWIVILAIPILVSMFLTINRHYASVAQQLRLPEGRPPRMEGTRAVVLVERVDEAAMRALGYARAMRPRETIAVHVGRDDDVRLVDAAWSERRLTVPLRVVAGDPNNVIPTLRTFIRELDMPTDEFVTVVIPETYERGGWRHYISRRRTFLLKASLLFERRVVVTDVPVPAQERWGSTHGAIAPTRVIATVLVSAVHNATLRALEYARSLSPTDLHAVTFNVDPDETERVLSDWGRIVDDIPLEAQDSPYREVARPLVKYVRQLRAQRPDVVVSVILPEFIPSKWWHQFLHNQTALTIKAALLFEPGVVVTSVPFHLE